MRSTCSTLPADRCWTSHSTTQLTVDPAEFDSDIRHASVVLHSKSKAILASWAAILDKGYCPATAEICTLA